MARGAVSFAAFSMLAVGAAQAAEIKVGLLSQYSGTYAWWGQEFDRGVELFLSETGGKVGDHTITVVKRDEGGTSAQRARQLAQELVIRDKVQYLLGGAFTPTIMGTADIVNQTKTPYVMGNTGTSSVTDKSPYFVRAGFTQWQLNMPLTKWAYEQGARKVVTIGADFAPGHDALEAYAVGFKDMGGEVVEEIRVPLGTTDFSTYLQRIQDAGVKHVFMFMPVGPMSAGFIKAFYERGLNKQGIALMATNETMESDLPAIGDVAIGMVTAQHYTPYLDNAANKAFVQKYKAKFGADAIPSLGSLAVYDGMHLIAQMIKATNGEKDGDKAVAAIKGYAWESPRGPVKIDADTREIVQNVYMRRIEKVDGVLGNVPFQTFEAVVEPWHARKAK
ncbi:branched-chain amino acid ABC transporter substrate-binding protein [Pusillimonas sp. T2]|nr:branched-chain amino acid ABC transporter substrate-binding protein [Pusillimonas sp. T2]ROT45881.1 branched-chain amino acid ABC transporter substrate-binding protein [Pusillimonas sp. NJUB218]